MSALTAVLLFATSGSAQTGAVTGTVREAATGQLLEGAQVLVQGTGLGALSRGNGRFLIPNVPVGARTIEVQLIGFATVTQEVAVQAGQTVHVEISMVSTAIALTGIVVTGVSGATQRTKLPFEVAQIKVEDLPTVPVTSPAGMLQAKVPGVTVVQGSGRPGATPEILLRGPTSLNAIGRDQSPLFIVDGVILGATLIDLDALDVESVEIVKGAAAASLYGSRAAAGVVQIRTRRGRAFDDNQVRYSLRSEYGRSELPHVPEDLLTQTHQYALNAQGLFVNEDGSTCVWLECTSPVLAGQRAAAGEEVSSWNTFQTQRWPGQTFNQIERFFENGDFLRNYVSVEGRSGDTNFHVSMANMQEEGVLPGLKGFTRNNFRVNVDQAVLENVQVSASAYYSRSTQDQFPETQGNPLFDLTRMPAGVDLLSPDPDDPDEIILIPDPTNIESPNPLYELFNREYDLDKSRFLASGNLRYSALDWLDVDANISFDRLDLDEQDFWPKGFRTPRTDLLNEGYMDRWTVQLEALNASVTATGRFRLTPQIFNRTQVRYLYEEQDYEELLTGGYEFAVAGVPVISNLNPERLFSDQYLETIRADGYFVITNFDMYDRYVIDALVRNDGSSLFGADERRQWYYRVAGAWRLTQEDWFTVDGLDELKLRYSLGTAGGRPTFSAQYETYTVTGGRVTPVTLGNQDLKPEFSTEHEAGIDAAFGGGKLVLGLTYANTSTKDQILPVPLPAYAGFSTQWRNAGTLESKTWEASLDARLVETPNLNWSARLIFDRTRSEITELTVPPFTYGVGLPTAQLHTVFYAREGEEYGTLYGVKFASGCGDLPAGLDCNQFAVNDEGLLVWVGAGGSLSTPQWGSRLDGALDALSKPVLWGSPVAGQCTDAATGELTAFCPVGTTMPDFSLGLSSTLSWRGFSLYGLLDAVQGFEVYNQPLQWATFQRTAGIIDQSDVSESERKPLGYFDQLYGTSGLNPSTAFVEDGSFVKLRELSLGYRLNTEQLDELPGLGWFSSIGLSVTGRNLLTWTDYRGYDPEVGKGGGQLGSAALARVEGFQYPNFRTWTLALDLGF
jgi:TonB-linked SusC/RagA family outer membrane protein